MAPTLVNRSDPGAAPLSGVHPVIQTPFHLDGTIDWGSLDREVEWLFAQGADGVVFAMVSEILRMSSEERDEVAQAISRCAAGRGHSTISVGAESVATAVRHARAAVDAGASAVMAAPPALFATEDDELFAYYLAIADASSVPVVVQDASGYVGKPLSIDLQRRLYDELGDMVYFKPESHPIGPRVTELREQTSNGARIFEGTGGLHLVESWRRGAVGTMPAADLIWALVPLWHALEVGDFARAYRIAGPLAQIITLQTSLDAFVAMEKHNLVRQGILPRATMRQPVGRTADAHTFDEVDRLVDLLRQAVSDDATSPLQPQDH